MGSHRTTHGFSKPNIQLPQDGLGRCRRGVSSGSHFTPELLSSNAQQWVLFWGEGRREWAHSQFMFCFYEWKMEKAPKGTVLGGPKRGISAHAACGLALGQMGEWARGRAEGGRPRTWQALPSLLCLPTHVFLPSLSCPPPSPLPPRSKTQLSRAGRPHCSLDGSSEGLLGSWAPGTRLLCMLW